MLSWQNGRYIKADGIFAEVISHKANVWKLKSINRPEVFFLVTDGQDRYAHGDSLAEATADLAFKTSDRDKSQYVNLTLATELTYSDAIKMYRVVTGACSAGTKDFIQSHNIETRSYTVKEILKLTNGQYGHNQLQSFIAKVTAKQA
jgi:hypothetical protein